MMMMMTTVAAANEHEAHEVNPRNDEKQYLMKAGG